ncbi:MAG: mechanosensitive ion channel family protein [Candidatus Omnitrophica bacterium]|nr:mechanosensitive ion channel family protein [Candidatus Omnitrophota bacterium]
MLESILSHEIFQKFFLGNTVLAYLKSLILFAGGIAGLWVLNKVILIRFKTHAQKTETKMDDFVFRLIERTVVPLLFLGAFLLAIKNLVLTATVNKVVNSVAIAFLVIQATRFLLTVLTYFLDGVVMGRGTAAEMGEKKKTSKTIVTVIRVVGWGVAVVFLLDNLGFNISAVVAGLGIGGVAVALAAQTILGDLFNYFVIFFDKPFEEGDFIIVEDHLGVIEHIGIKTTRIRSLGGEQIIFSNSDLTGSRIRNYKRMQRRRVVFKVGVVYQTTLEQIKKAPQIIKEIIEGLGDVVFDRAHFMNFGNFSLDIEVVYYVLSGDYNMYMDMQQAINLKIKEAFEKENIEFAYPTQTLFVEK